jgi:hypothetical protein
LRFGKRRAVDLGQDLAPADVFTKRRPNLRDAPGHKRRYYDLAIRIRLDDSWQPEIRRRRSTRDRRYDDPRTFHRILTERNDHVR